MGNATVPKAAIPSRRSRRESSSSLELGSKNRVPRMTGLSLSGEVGAKRRRSKMFQLSGTVSTLARARPAFLAKKHALAQFDPSLEVK
jgi:hypothetical protein